MGKQVRKEVADLLNQYRERIASEFNIKKTVTNFSTVERLQTEEYLQFKKEYMPKHITWYEKACGWSEKILKLTPGKKKLEQLTNDIQVAHLQITPTGATSFAILGPLLFAMLSGVVGFVAAALFLPEPSTFPILFAMMSAVALIFACRNIPSYLAIRWRLKASNQMVLSVFYTVTFMRHTSNLEGALLFAGNHVDAPLSLDFKRILWNVETEKFSSVRESLDEYLETWREWNPEFIDSFHLIESSQFEGTEARRLNNLDKSLTVMLEGTYEKMLHFAHNLASPINILNMLGIILPILGLVILPLVVSFLAGENTTPLTLVMIIGALYNIAIPAGVLYLGKAILAKRPTGYGESDITVNNPELGKYKNIIVKLGGLELKLNPLLLSIAVFFVFAGIAILPMLLHSIGFQDIGIGGPSPVSTCGQKFCLLDYHPTDSLGEVGPFGLGAALLSIFLPLGMGLSIGMYYKTRATRVFTIREKNKQLETEFASALFQLGNRLGDGLPAEIAFGKVANSMQGSISGDFFQVVHQNITRLGMSVQSAIFDPKQGALHFFPSNLIQSSMKVLVQSAQKGPKVAAQALVNVSQYIKEIHRVNERLKDLLADSISSMDTQIKFLAPAIAGIVVGITSMVGAILSQLRLLIEQQGSAGAGDLAGITQILGDGMPTYYFQIVVGVYVIQIIVILTILVNNIRNGDDHLQLEYLLGKNLTKGAFLYCFIAVVVMLLFNILAAVVLEGIGAPVPGT